MKKSIVLCAGLCAVLMFASCGSKESAYRKAYDKAKAAEAEAALNNPSQNEAPVVTPLTQQQPQQQTVDNYDNATVRTENVTLVNGSGLKEFSVVVGSFSVLANAQGLQNKLKAAATMHRLLRTMSVDSIVWWHRRLPTRLTQLVRATLSVPPIPMLGCCIINKESGKQGVKKTT